MDNKKYIFIAIAVLAGWIGGYLFHKEEIGKTSSVEGLPVLATCADDGKSVIFSCAMHNQVKSPEKGLCPICGMELTTAIRNLYKTPLKFQMSPAAVALSNITTQAVNASPQTEEIIRIQGTIEVDPNRLFHQTVHLPGRIEKMYINEVGASIRKGQPIASVYSKELIAVVEAFEYSKHSESVIRSAENNIRNWKLSPERFRNMDLSSNEHHRAVDIYSDFSGTIMKTYIQEGDHAANTHMGHPTRAFDIADLSKVRLVFEIHESQLSVINAGQKIDFSIPSVPERIFSARIDRILPTVDVRTGFASFIATVDNSDGALRPGMMVTAEIEFMRNKTADPNTISIPKTAILWTGEQSVVYVKDTQFRYPVYECRKVKIGSIAKDHYLIESGLSKGEEVVISGLIRLDAAAQIEGKSNMMMQ